MIWQLTVPLHAWGLRWKPTSLEYMDVGALKNVFDPLVVTMTPPGLERLGSSSSVVSPSEAVNQTIVELKQVDEIIVLGTKLNRTLDDYHDIRYRLQKGITAFWRDRRYYQSMVIPWR
eukprot:530818-Pyramimonas_sp.AAC.1